MGAWGSGCATPKLKLLVLEITGADVAVVAAAVVAAPPNWNMLPVLRGCPEAELQLLVVGGADQFPKRDLTPGRVAG